MTAKPQQTDETAFWLEIRSLLLSFVALLERTKLQGVIPVSTADARRRMRSGVTSTQPYPRSRTQPPDLAFWLSIRAVALDLVEGLERSPSLRGTVSVPTEEVRAYMRTQGWEPPTAA